MAIMNQLYACRETGPPPMPVQARTGRRCVESARNAAREIAVHSVSGDADGRRYLFIAATASSNATTPESPAQIEG